MWNRYAKKVFIGMGVLSVGISSYEFYTLLHPPPSFTSSVSDFRPALAGLSRKLAMETKSHVPKDLGTEPTEPFYLTPIVPVEQIKEYILRTEADFLLIDFEQAEMKGDSLFRYLYSRVCNPPPLASCTTSDKEPKCFLLFYSLIHSLMLRASIHTVTADTQWYESPAILAYCYSYWYGAEAYKARLGQIRFPVVVLQNTHIWENVEGDDMKTLMDFYLGLLRLIGTAHIFIDATPGVEKVLKILNLHMPTESKPPEQATASGQSN